ncbi:MAG: hypothetical protein IPL65_21495 [Lewinellaceae bacterium]|nr:hypothetical protein [Lewinellaceae bacterium]
MPERDPQSWIMQGSNDGNNWVPLDTRSNEDFPNRFQQRAFPISSPAPYTHYRLFVTESAGANEIQLEEVELVGTDPNGAFFHNVAFDGHFSRTKLAPGDYRYEISDASATCASAEHNVAAFVPITASGLKVVQDGNCGVAVETPIAGYDYYWLSDEIGTALLGEGASFQPPHAGNFYVTAAPSGTGQWSSNRRGFAVTMPATPEVTDLGNGQLAVVNPAPETAYLWYDSDNCGVPLQVGNTYNPGPQAADFYIAAISTIDFPDPIDPATIPGLLLRMDAADLNGDGMIDDPAPPTSSVLDWYFPTGNKWAENNWFAYRSNYQNGLGIADWATLWLQRIQNAQNNFQTVIMAYQENELSWDKTAPFDALSTTMPRHSDASAVFKRCARFHIKWCYLPERARS